MGTGHTRRGRARRTVAFVAVGAVGLAATGATTAAGHDEPRAGLRIMLTNDDGWNAPGIIAVYDALVAEGHEVIMVAPLTNQSGVGGRITFGGALTVTQPEAGKYVVAGSPADATEFGLSVVYAGAPPDLVISGTNAGQNIAAATVHSGTVGAAVTALNDGVPAIAISTEISLTGATPPPPFVETAAFLVQLLDELQDEADGDALMPLGVGLNVNYPIVDSGGAPAGVELTRTGKGFIDVGFGARRCPRWAGPRRSRSRSASRPRRSTGLIRRRSPPTRSPSR